MNGPLIALAAFCLWLIVVGVLWYWFDPFSAGRPASLLALMGALGLGVTWWLS